MTAYDEYDNINPSRVAVENRNITDPDPYSLGYDGYVKEGDRRRRRLHYRYYEWMKEEQEVNPEWYVVVESLEIKVRPGTFSELNYLNLTWEILSFNEDMIFFQLHFEHPERISEAQEFDTLEVYFWGTQFFTSSDSSMNVRYGTMVARELMR